MRAEKKQMVEELAGLMKDRAVVLMSYQGLKANAFNAFRAKVAGEQVNGKCQVVQNTLVKKAAVELGYNDLAGADLNGDTAMVSGPDAVSLVKAVKEFAADKENSKEHVKIKLAFVEGQLLNAADALALANLPPKEVVLAQLLGLIQAPASGIARALNAKVASVLYLLDAYRSKLEKEQTA
ncbi:MAG: 50S ribosomal protein L10 [Victivallales bacterium]|nr:50S ribosomal protein L10 [Victivallales bacterium]